MKLVDSHCHLNLLNLEKYQGNLSKLIETAQTFGVETILCVGVDLIHLPEVLKISETFSHVFASIGLHPSEKVEEEPTVKEYVELAAHSRVIAIGETGLDYYWNKDNLALMRERFRRQIRAAIQVKKPLIIHTRDAREDTLTIMREEGASRCGGVMHCFTENWEMAKAAIDLGFFISFSGIITFKNGANVASVAEKVPLDRILIETDAPFLTPVPFRGQANEPQYVRFVAEKIAALKNISVEEVAEQTTENFFRLFSQATN